MTPPLFFFCYAVCKLAFLLFLFLHSKSLSTYNGLEFYSYFFWMTHLGTIKKPFVIESDLLYGITFYALLLGGKTRTAWLLFKKKKSAPDSEGLMDSVHPLTTTQTPIVIKCSWAFQHFLSHCTKAITMHLALVECELLALLFLAVTSGWSCLCLEAKYGSAWLVFEWEISRESKVCRLDWEVLFFKKILHKKLLAYFHIVKNKCFYVVNRAFAQLNKKQTSFVCDYKTKIRGGFKKPATFILIGIIFIYSKTFY